MKDMFGINLFHRATPCEVYNAPLGLLKNSPKGAQYANEWA